MIDEDPLTLADVRDWLAEHYPDSDVLRTVESAVNLFPLYEAVREAGSREHRWIEGVDPDGDDWLGCICGERDGCDTLHALDALQAAEDAL